LHRPIDQVEHPRPDYDHRDEGRSIPLTGAGNLKFYSVSLSMTFHFEQLPD